MNQWQNNQFGGFEVEIRIEEQKKDARCSAQKMPANSSNFCSFFQEEKPKPVGGFTKAVIAGDFSPGFIETITKSNIYWNMFHQAFVVNIDNFSAIKFLLLLNVMCGDDKRSHFHSQLFMHFGLIQQWGCAILITRDCLRNL